MQCAAIDDLFHKNKEPKYPGFFVRCAIASMKLKMVYFQLNSVFKQDLSMKKQ